MNGTSDIRRNLGYGLYPVFMMFLFFDAKSNFYWDEYIQGSAGVALMIIITIIVVKRIIEDYKDFEQ